MSIKAFLDALNTTVKQCSLHIRTVRDVQSIEHESRHLDIKSLTDKQKLAKRLSETLKDLAPKNKHTRHIKRVQLSQILKDAAALKGKKQSYSDDKIAQDEKNGFLPPTPKVKDADGIFRYRGYDANAVLAILDAYELTPSLDDYLEDISSADIPSLTNINPIVLAVFMLKGGCGKTTTTIHLAQYLAMKGHKTLIIDTDPQGSSTFQMGFTPDFDVTYDDTIVPFLLGDEEAIKKKITRIKKAEAAGAGIYDEEFVNKLSENNIRYAIKRTNLKTLDIIPACLHNDFLSTKLPMLYQRGVHSESAIIQKLRNVLCDLSEYDFIVLDGTPSLNASSSMYFMAADMVISPIPARLPDFVSSTQYNFMISKMIKEKHDQFGFKRFPLLASFITRFGSQASHRFIENFARQSYVNGIELFSNTIGNYSAVDDATAMGCTLYEATPSDIGSEQLKKALHGYNCLFDEIFNYIQRHLINMHQVNYRCSNQVSDTKE